MNKPKILSKKKKKQIKKEKELKNAKMEDILKCDSCRNGFCRMDMIIGPDPYQSEVNDDNTIVALCERCYHEACQEI